MIAGAAAGDAPGMKLFVTGAGGFLGAATARAALAAGHEVTALVRRDSARLADLAGPLRVIVGDMREIDRIAAMVAEHRPDAVVHAAWAGLSGPERRSLDQFAQVGTCWRLAAAAAEAGATRFVGIGSQDEYGPHEGRIDETCLPRPVSAYGAAKLAASLLAGQAARHHGAGFAWLRLFAVYGPGDGDGWLIPSLARRMLAGERPRTTAGTQRWDYLYIDDAARGVVAAATAAGVDGVFNLSSGSAVPVRDVVEQLRDRAAPGMPLVFGEIPFAPGQIMHLEGANERLKAATGWAPSVTLGEGLDRTVAALAALAAPAREGVGQ